MNNGGQSKDCAAVLRYQAVLFLCFNAGFYVNGNEDYVDNINYTNSLVVKFNFINAVF